MSLHKNLPATEVHVVHSLVYANDAERLSASGFNDQDVGRIALQMDDRSFWVLTRIFPLVWVSINAISNPMSEQGDSIVGGTGGNITRLPGLDGGYFRSGGIVEPSQFTRTLDVHSLLATETVSESPDPCAAIQINSTTKGLLPSRMTAAQRNSLVSVPSGLTVYTTDFGKLFCYDGTIWRALSDSGLYLANVLSDGSGDYATIQQAIDSFSGLTDFNRATVIVSSGTFSENIHLRDYVTVVGQGWDTVLVGSVDMTGISDGTIRDMRVVSVNRPAFSGPMLSTGSGLDILSCYLFSTWTSGSDPTATRCAIEHSSGYLYSYLETNVTVTVTDIIHNGASVCCSPVHVSGTDEAVYEQYGTYNYLETVNPGNTLSALCISNTNPDTSVLSETGATRIHCGGVDHDNIFTITHATGNGEIEVVNQRASLVVDNTNTLKAMFALANGSPSNVKLETTWINFRINGVDDSGIFVGGSCSANDNVEVSGCTIETSSDIIPIRYTALGAAGNLVYTLENNFGSSYNLGTINGVRIYPQSPTNPVDPPPGAGDTYFNTVSQLAMNYDAVRVKWITTESLYVLAGRRKNTAAGSFYCGPDGITFGPGIGIPVLKGTVVALALGKADVLTSTVEVLVNDTVICEMLCTGSGQTTNTLLNADFEGGLMQFRNKIVGDITTNVTISCVLKRRV